MAAKQHAKANGVPKSVANFDGAPCDAKGSILIIGGKESKEGHRPILEELARRTGSGRLVVATLASEEPEEQWDQYRRIFHELGVKDLRHLDVRERKELLDHPKTDILDALKVFFFAGGDQMKITSKFGGTPLCQQLREAYMKGATIAGTSSGASVMSEVMMAAGEGDASHEVGGSLRLASGLGLIAGVVIDQHFAERGRMGRLLGAVAQNPRLLGIGIDEDTAVMLGVDGSASVMGSGAVYMVDGREMTYTNAGENQVQTLSAFGIKVHVLSRYDQFRIDAREPVAGPRETAPGA